MEKVIENKTDAQIQVTIGEKFSNCTVLTIAHRLHTIMDSDRVFVLDEGSIMEFDTPYLLLQKSEGMFRKLVEQTGKTETAHLLEIAKSAYTKSTCKDIAENDESGDDDEVEEGVDMMVDNDIESSQATIPGESDDVLNESNLDKDYDKSDLYSKTEIDTEYDRRESEKEKEIVDNEVDHEGSDEKTELLQKSSKVKDVGETSEVIVDETEEDDKDIDDDKDETKKLL